MDLSEAKRVLRLLASGVDPNTGEVFPDDSPYHSPKVIRALFIVLEVLRDAKTPKMTIEEKQEENLRAGRPRNTGLPWTPELKDELAERFRAGMSISDLAKHFERSKGAIVSELMKQGLIEERIDGFRPGYRPRRVREHPPESDDA